MTKGKFNAANETLKAVSGPRHRMSLINYRSEHFHGENKNGYALCCTCAFGPTVFAIHSDDINDLHEYVKRHEYQVFHQELDGVDTE